MFLHVKDVSYVSGYTLRLTFDNGDEGEVNLENELWGEMFEPLKDPELFKAVKVDPELETLCWPNGADFAPEFLHDLMRHGQRSIELESEPQTQARPYGPPAPQPA